MKKVIFTLLLSCTMLFAFSQSTYYWVGGTSGSWSSSSAWSLTLGGTGGARTTPAGTDILIFDGTNIGAGATGGINVQPATETVGELRLINSADLSLARTSSGTTTVTVSNLLTVGAVSKLSVTGNSGAVVLVLLSAATGNISGNLFITGTGANRLSIQAGNSLNFLSGSSCTANSGTSPFSTLTTSTNPSVDKSVVFQNGSSFIYQGGANPFGGSSVYIAQFSTGSTFIFETTNISGILSTTRVLSNVIVRNNAVVTADGNPYSIDNLTIAAGSTFNMRLQGTFPVTGNILNDGTFGAVTAITTNNLVMYGTSPQTISGTGVFNAIGALSIGTASNVTLERSLILNGTSSSSVSGKLNLKTNTLTGTNNWQAKPATTTNFTADFTAGSQVITNVSVFSGVGIGSLVVGSNIPANTYVVATSLGSALGGSLTISNAPTATATAVAIVGSNGSPTLQVSNANGIDAAIAVTGTRSFGAGTNYIFDAATTTPFSISSSNPAGDVTINANTTTNRTNLSILGTLTLNTGKLTIQSSDTVRISSGNAIAGGSFSSSKYIATAVSGANVGVLAMDAFSTARTFPVGSTTNYLPVTLTPTSANDGFAISVFEGITVDGTSNGTAMNAAQKAKVVDAVWTINRTSTNIDNCAIALNWPVNLEGSSFNGYGNNIGIGRYSGTWGIVGGSGNNTANTATNTFNAFSTFGVGQLGYALPVKLSNLSAREETGKIKIHWDAETEINVDAYTIERAADGVNFSAINTVPATGSKQYSSIDNAPMSLNYYRIKVVNKNGSPEYSAIVKVKLNNSKAEIAVYPNPVKGNLVSLQLSNLEKGASDVKVYNSQGQLILTKNINYAGGNQIEAIALPATISKGLYRLVVTNNQTKLQQTIMVD